MGRFLGIDLGTSALKCLVVNERGETLAEARRVLSRVLPRQGWIEQQPEDWWQAALSAIKECLIQLGGDSIDAISFSGHMSAPVLLGSGGLPLRNAILIADDRGLAQAEYLQREFGGRFKAATGNPPINAFSAARLLWIAQNELEIYQKTECIMSAKDFLRFKLCGEAATEATDAGNTLLYDPATGDWNRTLIADIGLDAEKFAPLLASTQICGEVTGEAARLTGLKAGTPVITGAADMACSQAGSGAFKKNVAALTLSTSIQLVEAAQKVEPDLVGRITYHPGALAGSRYLMSSIFSGGMSIDWLMKLTGGGKVVEADYRNIKAETLSRFERGEFPGAIFLPFLTGSGSPWFNGADTGTFYGLTPATDAAELMLAAFEGIAFNVRDNMDLLAEHWPAEKEVVLAGGGSRFPVWPHILADVLDRPIRLLRNKDAATLGAAMLAGLGAGEFNNLDECFDTMNGVEKTYYPNPDRAERAGRRYRIYRELIIELRKVARIDSDNI